MLKAIYVFFLGLLTAVVIANGITAFYVPPPPVDNLSVYVNGDRPTSKQEREQLRRWQTYSKLKESYDRNASVIAFVIGVIIGIAALALSPKVSVICDGLLLGGMFTIVYAVFVGMTGGNEKFRFVIGLLGLLAAIGIGYVKFVRPRTEQAAT